jgi:hypothetical protein
MHAQLDRRSAAPLCPGLRLVLACHCSQLGRGLRWRVGAAHLVLAALEGGKPPPSVLALAWVRPRAPRWQAGSLGTAVGQHARGERITGPHSERLPRKPAHAASASARTYASSALPWLALCATTSGLPLPLSAYRLAKSGSGSAARLLGLMRPRFTCAEVPRPKSPPVGLAWSRLGHPPPLASTPLPGALRRARPASGAPAMVRMRARRRPASSGSAKETRSSKFVPKKASTASRRRESSRQRSTPRRGR